MEANQIFYNLLQRVNCRCTICRNTSDTPREVAECSYRPFNSEGQQVDNPIAVFNIRDSLYNVYDSPESLSFRSIREQYENYGSYNVTNGNVNMTGVKTIYRKCAIQWNELSFLQMPSPRRPGPGNVGYSEHSFTALATADDFTDAPRYNNAILRNAKFCFLLRNLELQHGVYGFYKNPFVKLNQSNWTTDWSFLENSSCSLSEWVRILNMQSNKEVLQFLGFVKSGIMNYAKGLKLEDSRHWEQMREEGNYVRHLLQWVKMSNTAFNLAYNGLAIIWFHLARSQADLAKLIEQLVKK